MAVRVEKDGVQVDMEDGFSVREGGEEGVDLLVDGMRRITSGKDRKQGDFGVRHFGAEIFEDHADTFGRDFRGIRAVAGIVCADHDDDGFRGEAVDLAVAEAPKDILGLVGVVAEVQHGHSGECFCHDLRGCGTFQTLGDRVAEEDEIDLSTFLRDLTELGFVAGTPPIYLPHRCKCRVLVCLRGGLD